VRQSVSARRPGSVPDGDAGHVHRPCQPHRQPGRGGVVASPDTDRLSHGAGPGHCPNGGPAVHGVVTDTCPQAAAGNLQATITWGDGHTSAGTLLTNADGTFGVEGTNTHARAGAYALTVTIQDTLHDLTVTATGTASVSPPRGSLGAAGLVVSATTGQPFQGVVAVVDDTYPGISAGQLLATVT
jgi:hypothetical protein